MYGIRRKISAGAVASMAVLGLLGVASAPAAAGPGSVSRPFLTGVHAASSRERSSWYRLAFPRARGSSKLDSTLARTGAGGSRKAPPLAGPGDHGRRDGARRHRDPDSRLSRS